MKSSLIKLLILVTIFLVCAQAAIENRAERRRRRPNIQGMDQADIENAEGGNSKFNEPSEEQIKLERQRDVNQAEQREQTRQRERDRAQERRKKTKFDRMDEDYIKKNPQGFENFNKHKVDEDVIKNPRNIKKNKEQEQREQEISQRMKEKIEKQEQDLKTRQEKRNQKAQERKEKMQQYKKQDQKVENHEVEETEEQIQERLQKEQEILQENQKDKQQQLEDQKIQDEIDLEKIKAEHEINQQSTFSWLSEWEELMTDFEADEMLTFEVEGRTIETFHEDIEKPCNIRGAYFMDYQSKTIDFYIENPRGKRIFSKSDKHGVFSINVGEKDPLGTYNFVFSNRKQSQTQQVSFAIDVTDNETYISVSDITTIEDVAKDTKIELVSQLRQAKLQKQQTTSQMKATKSIHTKMLLFTLAETVIIIACAVWQVYYIKKILDNKSII